MSTITQYFTKKWATISGALKPIATGDVFKGSDYVRDFWWLHDRVGKLLEDLVEGVPILLTGGLVTEGSDYAHINISALVGYVPFSVTVGVDALSPPTSGSEDVSAVRVQVAAQTDLSIATATLDNATVNYVKLAYVEQDNLTRTRLKSSGTYAFTEEPGYSITIDAVAPTGYEILLASFIGDGSTTLTITQAYGSLDTASWAPTATSSLTLLTVPKNLHVNPSTYTATVNLPTAASSTGRRVRIGNTGTSTGTIVVTPASGDSLAGITDGTWTITEPSGWLEIESDGTGWNVVSQWGSILSTVLTSNVFVSSPALNTWYNPTGASLSVGAGVWRLSYKTTLMLNWGTSVANLQIQATLSDTAGASSDSDLTSFQQIEAPSTAFANLFSGTLTAEKILSLSAAATRYLNIQGNGPSAPTQLGIAAGAGYGNTVIRAERVA